MTLNPSPLQVALIISQPSAGKQPLPPEDAENPPGMWKAQYSPLNMMGFYLALEFLWSPCTLSYSLHLIPRAIQVTASCTI